MRHGVVRLTLDVPQDQVLLSWAAAAFKPLAGQVVFRDGKEGPALETLVWETGHCVGYREQFVSGDTNTGAYVCQLTIAAPQLTMKPGGPAAYVSPAPGEHGSPQQAYLGAPLAVAAAAAAATAVETFVVPTLEQIAAAGLSALGRTALATAAAAALPAALTVGFVLMPTNSRDDPGYAAEWDLGRLRQVATDKDRARLDYLEAEREHRPLTDAEEEELASLLAVVRKVFVGGRLGLPVYYQQRTEALALVSKLKPPNPYHSINTMESRLRFGKGTRHTPKTIAKGHVNLQVDFTEIQAGNAVYDKQTQTFTTISGRVYGFHPDQIAGGRTSAIYPIRGNPGDFVNVTQAEFDILKHMPENEGLHGYPKTQLERLIHVGNKGVDKNTEAKLLDLFNSRQP